ncbi:GDP-fucose protein O-fucosyltransferase 3 isoform X2 [Denticeps clupeoides]|uniref:GDP-fucose protein O-fucosyltransferase 3 isoform X2 n=1 Tax=Denticeps clupeoides TaxID=299321 RepID=UPI0010A34563|nr:alpha-(1,3)-fucosyltransferase 10 isoform X2 [Denticeps clupeoides]
MQIKRETRARSEYLCVFQVLQELVPFGGKGHRSPPEKKELQRARGGRSPVNKQALSGSEHLYPVIVWWSPLTGELSRLGECGANKCFFTINRTYHLHPATHAFLFYGTDFSFDSLPLPREQHHHWALLHEESPKNNYKLFHRPVITLFNHTATFSRHSHLPLTTQYLESLDALTSHGHLLPLAQKNRLRAALAPVVYVQSDCDPPSDRDAYVAELMRHIHVDSYGRCLHNRDLPGHLRESSAMDEQDFLRILAQYKFILAFENAVCDDYITEKLWRPLKLGVVPVYYGAPNAQHWLPSNKSAVIVDPDEPPERLADYLKRLDENDEEYLTFLEWKHKREVSSEVLLSEMRGRQWGLQDLRQDNYIDVFECMVCNRVWENISRQKQGLPAKPWQAEESHLKCPRPRLFGFDVGPSNGSSLRKIWRPSYDQSVKEARALRHFALRNRNFTEDQFWTQVFSG